MEKPFYSLPCTVCADTVLKITHPSDMKGGTGDSQIGVTVLLSLT